MSTGERMPWSLAREVVNRFDALISPFCERRLWCGSYRRRRDTVGDLDLVIAPKYIEQLGLGGVPIGEKVNAAWARLDEMLQTGEVGQAKYGETGATRWGPKLRGLTFTFAPPALGGEAGEILLVKIEVHVACTDNWGLKVGLATGPDTWNKMCVTRLKAGGVYTQDKGLVLRKDGSVLPVRTEEEWFKLCNLAYVEPQHRESVAASMGYRA